MKQSRATARQALAMEELSDRLARIEAKLDKVLSLAPEPVQEPEPTDPDEAKATDQDDDEPEPGEEEAEAPKPKRGRSK